MKLVSLPLHTISIASYSIAPAFTAVLLLLFDSFFKMLFSFGTARMDNFIYVIIESERRSN